MDSLLHDIFSAQSWVSYLFLLTAVIGLVQFKKFKSLSIRVFIISFAYCAVNDFMALPYGRRWSPNEFNSILYNISYIITFLSLFYVFYSHIENKLFRRFISLMTLVYVVSVFIELLVLEIDYFAGYQIMAYIAGGVSMLIFILFYFYEAINSEKSIALERRFIFWVALGYFFYFLAKVPFVVNKDFYVNNPAYQYLFTINSVMTIILCISLIIGFIWSRPQDRS